MILFLVCLSFVFVVFQLINVLLNFFFRQKIDVSDMRIAELISILIPARNEAGTIELLMSDLTKITDTQVEILVFDDQSTDATAAIVKQFALQDDRVKLYQSAGMPEHWLGKNYACHQLSKSAKGQYFLFLDADVRVEASMVKDAVAYMKTYGLGLFSVFPKQMQKSIGEKATVPIMNYILLTLLPLIAVRTSPYPAHAAANGQFMLFDSSIYRAHDLHKRFALSVVEDICIARYMKEQDVKIACVTGEERIRCRMYHSYKESLTGFSKNIFMFFGNKPALAFAFWALAALGFIPMLCYNMTLLWFYLTLVVVIQILYSKVCRQPVGQGLLLFPLQLFFLIHVLIFSLQRRRNKKYVWKNRNVYS